MMGFDVDLCVIALERNQDNPSLAVEWLMSDGKSCAERERERERVDVLLQSPYRLNECFRTLLLFHARHLFVPVRSIVMSAL